MNRRKALKYAGSGALAVVSLAAMQHQRNDGEESTDDDIESVTPPTADGSQGGTEPEPTQEDDPDEDADPEVRHADAYENVVHAVDAGADPDGDEPINSILDDHAGDNTLISFPEGTYRVRPFKLAGRDSFGIAAAGDERATFKATADICLNSPYLQFEGMSNLLVDGIDFDFTDETAGGGFKILGSGDVTVANAHLRGSCPKQVAAFRIDVVDDDSVGLVKNVTAEHTGNRKLTGIFVGKGHAGEVTFENCRAIGFSDNGLYASAPGARGGKDGTVHTVGGFYENNNIANVRLGSTGSSARNVTVRATAVPPGEIVNARGIRLRDKQGQLVENCSLYFGPDAGDSFGAIVFHEENGGATIRNTDVHVEAPEVPAIRTFSPNRRWNTAPRFEDVTITGDAPGSYAAKIFHRDDTTFENCAIKQHGDGRGGIRFKNSDGCRIVDSYIDVSRTPIVARNSTVLVENTVIATPDGARRIRNAVFEDEIITPR